MSSICIHESISIFLFKFSLRMFAGGVGWRGDDLFICCCFVFINHRIHFHSSKIATHKQKNNKNNNKKRQRQRQRQRQRERERKRIKLIKFSKQNVGSGRWAWLVNNVEIINLGCVGREAKMLFSTCLKMFVN